MTRYRFKTMRIATAGRAPRLILACLLASAVLPGFAPPARAQNGLPSVNDYRLPSGTSSPAVRSQGPVDPENPVATPPRAVRQPEQPSSPAATPSATPSAAASSATAATRTPPRPAVTDSAAPRPSSSSAAARSQSPVTPAASASPASAENVSAAASPSPAASGNAAEAALAQAPEIEWRVHSADEGPAWWQSPWVLALALIAGVGLGMALLAAMRRNREARAANDWQQEPATVETAPTSPAPEMAQQPATALPELDLRAVAPELAPSGRKSSAAPPASAARPALNVIVNPLQVELAARRLSATLLNTVLNYELVVRNNGSDAIGPVLVGGDMIAAHASLPDRAQLELSGNEITPLHHIASLAPGESATLSGEFKLALVDITPIRSGNAALFIPLARFRVEASRRAAPPLVASCTYVIGEDQELPGAALKPFRLDLGPRLYSRIGQRELALSA
jgi:hypothetical protein